MRLKMTLSLPMSAASSRAARLSCAILIPLLFAGQSWGKDPGNPVLIVPISIQVRSVDGESVKRISGGGISRNTNRYEMEPGERVVNLRYREIWPNNPHDDHDVAKSKWQNVAMDAHPGAVYQVTHPSFGSYNESKVFARNPQFTIEKVEEGSVEIGAGSEPEPADPPGEEMGAPEPESLATPEAPPEKLPPPVTAPADIRESSVDVGVGALDAEVSPLELMQFWWKRASSAERERFSEWITEPE